MIKWYGELPKNWNTLPLKYISEIITGNTPPKANENYYAESGVPWYKPDNILEFEKLSEAKEFLSTEGVSVARLIPKGAILVCCIGSIGKLAMADRDCVTNQQINSVVFNEKYCNFKYGFYALMSCKNEAEKLSNKVVVSILNKTSQGEIELPVPDLVKQKNIVIYLDKISDQINKIISKKMILLEKLEQQRQSIITEAVTKGLNPNVKMKESGVEWIGEIPEHWNTIKIKFVSEMKSGTSIDSLNINKSGQYRVYGGGELRGYTEEYTHDGEYVIVGRQGANCGQATFVTGKFWATEHAVVVATKKGVANWLYYVLKSMNLNQYSMSAAQPGIAVSTILNLAIPQPPMNEQKEIMTFLKNYDDEMTSIIKKTNLQIQKLKQYRQSLIYEAVTGKIDIRDLNLDEVR